MNQAKKQVPIKSDNYTKPFQFNLEKVIAKIPVLSVAMTGRNFAAKAFACEGASYRNRQQWRSFFCALLAPNFAFKWFKLLNHDDYQLLVANRPRLYFKPFRIYMSTRWNKQRRLKIILDTYRYIFDKDDLLKQVITNKDGIEMARFKLKDGMEGILVLGYDECYRKEGELVFSFVCDELGGLITSASFSMEETSTGWVCRIGCVQGHKTDEENKMKAAQNQMHGFRPKSMIIYAIQEFSRHGGFQAVYGAGDAIQVYRKKHAIHIPWIHKIDFDYNSTWEESGGKKSNDGWYELPLLAVRKSMEEIKSHKRAYYRRRYAIMDQLSSQMGEKLNRVCKSKETENFPETRATA